MGQFSQIADDEPGPMTINPSFILFMDRAISSGSYVTPGDLHGSRNNTTDKDGERWTALRRSYNLSFAKMRLIIGGRQQIGKLLITNAFGNADVRRRKKMRGGQKFGLEMFQEDIRQQTFRVVALSICGLFMLVILFKLGQDTEDNVTKVFETLVSIEWYDWNESNKKMYLMFLVSALKPYRIQFSENFSLNYNMAGQLLQSAASVVLVVYQLNFM
ncbi:hypothetical protein Zmor_013344 [Zophobas morio]|uniref:Uncharacterized protein n=1 Tax=Zophobas morio TaxID=2755281 RepID=A0AA38IAH5_9CUCU|nr:hypothetical protein Zmor_013344 [Zophobas morio]